MGKNDKNIAATVKAALEPLINELGYRLWDVEYVKEATEWYLRFTIDNDEGITIEDCEKVHRAVNDPLDELDPIEGAYHLEVSSPGVERDIRTNEHLEFCRGEKVEARLFAAVDGKKVVVGTLDDFTDDSIKVGGVVLPRDKVSKLHTVFEF